MAFQFDLGQTYPSTQAIVGEIKSGLAQGRLTTGRRTTDQDETNLMKAGIEASLSKRSENTGLALEKARIEENSRLADEQLAATKEENEKMRQEREVERQYQMNKEKKAQRAKAGSTIGGLVGMGIGAIFGVPMIGGAVGSSLGGLLGGK